MILRPISLRQANAYVDRVHRHEPGTSLRAAGWQMGPSVPGRSWDRPKRGRTDKAACQGEDKVRWQVGDWSAVLLAQERVS